MTKEPLQLACAASSFKLPAESALYVNPTHAARGSIPPTNALVAQQSAIKYLDIAPAVHGIRDQEEIQGHTPIGLRRLGGHRPGQRTS